MFYVKKTLEIAGAHRLNLSYESKCTQLHGHNWHITVYCKSEKLDENGMVCDFAYIKRVIVNRFDHTYLNDIEPFTNVNPTAENMAYHLWWLLQQYGCYRVDVQESDGNIAWYEEDPYVKSSGVGDAGSSERKKA